MSQWQGAVLTAAGRVLQAKVETGITLELTRIKLGDGTESLDSVDALTDLVSPKAILPISSAVAEGQEAVITGVMSATQLSAGFYCREWGLFARDPDVGEILYMVTIDSVPEWLPSSTQAAQVAATYALKVAVANSTSITVNVDPQGLVNVRMLNETIHALERNKAYALGDLLNVPTLKPGLMLECKVPGTTAVEVLDFSRYVQGDTIIDGTVTWIVKRPVMSASDFFEIDNEGNIMPADEPLYSDDFELDSNGDIMPKLI